MENIFHGVHKKWKFPIEVLLSFLEKSPNLTRFTEHFNKVSYWARTRILEQNEARDREKYVVKFIKIMKHLRKMNNFNSYLGLLSALKTCFIYQTAILLNKY
ncbi:rap guanine nucleotide exchange factor 1-like [Diaphorina citri]|uniref:Rap guanine nucleotide exchange factor 1-like n=1 Tax=Diaphorina citri TaxID=121845 RepID=A0A3Q0J240_DIACI|nr:rap guanine nucleotide exchange factor 1-like [Diaphorina citri]